MIHVMVDIEGMNTHPSVTRIMQLAAAPFDEYGVLSHLPTFNEFANTHQQFWTQDSASTMHFWKNQPNYKEMLDKQRKNGISGVALMQRFNEYLKSLGAVTLWACHPEYDLVVIREYMYRHKIEAVWPFYKQRDYATVRDRYRDSLTNEPVTHWADEDVLRQIKLLKQCIDLGWELA